MPAPAAFIDLTSTSRIPREPRFAITVIGDVRAELRAILTDSTSLVDHHDDVLCFAPVDFAIAGTAVNMARATAELFASVQVIAKIGNDVFTPAIMAETVKIRGDWRLVLDTKRGNGTVMILRDRSPKRPGGRRLLVSSTSAPNLTLSTAEIHQHAEAIGASDALFMDGYSTLSATSAACLLTAARIAREAGVMVCFDLVPHSIDNYLDPTDIGTYLNMADLVITEARTVARIFGVSSEYPFPTKLIAPLAERLVRKHPDVSYWILRFGAGDMQQSALCRPGHEVSYYETGYTTADVRTGFGDRIAAAEVFQLLKQRAVTTDRKSARITEDQDTYEELK
nr:carbohydrate kinase family protein [Micromonospora sp. DSM 115978]